MSLGAVVSLDEVVDHLFTHVVARIHEIAHPTRRTLYVAVQAGLRTEAVRLYFAHHPTDRFVLVGAPATC